jgi:hypothetical protein
LNREWLISVRAGSVALASQLGRTVGLLRAPAPKSARPPAPAQHPTIVQMPEEAEPAPKRPARRSASAVRAGLGGLGEVLDREDLWGRRH